MVYLVSKEHVLSIYNISLVTHSASSCKTARIEELLEQVSYLKSVLFGSSVKHCGSISRNNLVTLFIQCKVLTANAAMLNLNQACTRC